MAGLSPVHWLILLLPVVAVVAFVLGRRGAAGGRVDHVGPSARMVTPLPPGHAGPTPLTPELETMVWAELRNDRLIQAIKLVRDGTGMGLRDAKDLVEAMQRNGPQTR
jgi:hypothetical protein